MRDGDLIREADELARADLGGTEAVPLYLQAIGLALADIAVSLRVIADRDVA